MRQVPGYQTTWRKLGAKLLLPLTLSAVIAAIAWILVRAMTSGIRQYYEYLGM